MDRSILDSLFAVPLPRDLTSLAAGDIAPLGFTPSWIVLICAVLFVMYLTFRPKKRRDPLASQPFRTSLVQQRALERDMQNVIVELSEMTRQMSAQLETRAVKLEQLIRDADAKIAELRAAAEQAAPRMTLPAGEFEQIATDIVSADAVGTGQDDGDPASTPMMRIVNEHSEDRWAEVYRLGDEGLTLTEIARRLARPNGEVELILALRPKPEAGSRTEQTSPPDVAAVQ